jgi:hypothetical protein
METYDAIGAAVRVFMDANPVIKKIFRQHTLHWDDVARSSTDDVMDACVAVIEDDEQFKATLKQLADSGAVVPHFSSLDQVIITQLDIHS